MPFPLPYDIVRLQTNLSCVKPDAIDQGGSSVKEMPRDKGLVHRQRLRLAETLHAPKHAVSCILSYELSALMREEGGAS